jgi:SpoVK/Ycf46/Vps4 family AAA+-type ATPase
MVDCASFKKMVPNHASLLSPPLVTHQLDGIPDTDIHLCAPTVFGYSFASKKWGRLDAERFTEIVWNTAAFDHLVLEEEKKLLIKSLVCADRTEMITDVVSGKAGGSIVILHGKPGTGKTLTAEAAAEKGKRPLMVVSAAELANRASDLEEYLSSILEICEDWGAVLLIDEAEAYLETRSFGDVRRNAMVSVFLRLLEYHQQVIFLTTNHITRIDPAFKSRISVAIKYPELDENARESIWTRFLEMAGVQIHDTPGPQSFTKAELAELVKKKMNGRLLSIFCQINI